MGWCRPMCLCRLYRDQENYCGKEVGDTSISAIKNVEMKSLNPFSLLYFLHLQVLHRRPSLRPLLLFESLNARHQ